MIRGTRLGDLWKKFLKWQNFFGGSQVFVHFKWMMRCFYSCLLYVHTYLHTYMHTFIYSYTWNVKVFLLNLGALTVLNATNEIFPIKFWGTINRLDFSNLETFFFLSWNLSFVWLCCVWHAHEKKSEISFCWAKLSHRIHLSARPTPKIATNICIAQKCSL
jgi:hypothetical protein